MVNVEDAVKLLTIIKKKDVHLVDSRLRKWEDMTDGQRKLEQEEEKELEEWATWKIFQEELKMGLDQEQHQNLYKEKLNEEKMTIRSFFI